MKFCKQCGNRMEDTAAVCSNCGCPAGDRASAAAAAPAAAPTMAPAGQLKTGRGLIKFILLSLITCGIYSIIYYSEISSSINLIASKYDGKKTMHFCLMAFIVAPLTLGIGAIVWCHNISNRIGNELKRRNINYSFGASDFWIWNVLGSLIVVGPFIYIHKLSEAMNKLSESYNTIG